MKGSKDVHVTKTQERAETIVANCNVEGMFLPPYYIFNGVKKQQVWEENKPAGAVITMRKKSAYIFEEIFIDWLTNHFIPRKPVGKTFLILDGHGSHMNSFGMLETAAGNDIIMLCLLSHTTHFLKPLDQSFFKPLKSSFKLACDEFVRSNPNKRIESRHFGQLLGDAWSRSATAQTGVSGFRATGIYPLKPSVITEHTFISFVDINCSSRNENPKVELEAQAVQKNLEI
ncbi:MFS-type transporter clz9-like [Dendroctonus ponderosae]|uniref:MFS-type transporter clz9-like n=1 Tax=Dendroctonus ponderosae TaxID=77166 RepID=UPI002035C17E|nr:MFS-type transporter clz9-like [Dendroctonus ponderosae]